MAVVGSRTGVRASATVTNASTAAITVVTRIAVCASATITDVSATIAVITRIAMCTRVTMIAMIAVCATVSVASAMSAVAVIIASTMTSVAVVITSAMTMIAMNVGGSVVASVTIVSSVPAVTHTYVAIVVAMEVVAVSIVVTMSAMTMPSVSAAISGIEVRTSEVEIVTVRIACIDCEVPVSCVPVEGAVEVGSRDKGVPLCLQQDIAHIEVTALPIDTINIVNAGDSHQVVEVDLVGSLILLVRQVQLVSHLVRQEECLVTCLLVTHGMGRNCHCQQCYQGHH